MLKIISEPAYILHTYPYRETSLILEVFTHTHGRIGIIAKGAKRPQSQIRGLLQIFVPLIISASGRSDLLTLTSIESACNASFFNNNVPSLNNTTHHFDNASHFNTKSLDLKSYHFNLQGQRLISALYINELMINLLQRRDPHTDLFLVYQNALMKLNEEHCEQTTLRIFEKNLLKCLGYELQLTKDFETGEIIKPDQKYIFDPERGPSSQLNQRLNQPHRQSNQPNRQLNPLNQQLNQPPTEQLTQQSSQKKINMSTSSQTVHPFAHYIVEGQSLMDLNNEIFQSKRSLADAKRITRHALQLHLGAKILQTRKLLTLFNS